MKYEQELDEKVNTIDKLRQNLQITMKENEILKIENKKYLEEI